MKFKEYLEDNLFEKDELKKFVQGKESQKEMLKRLAKKTKRGIKKAGLVRK